MVNLWVWEKILAPILVTLDQGHQATEAGQNLICPHDKARTAHPIATRHICMSRTANMSLEGHVSSLNKFNSIPNCQTCKIS